MLKIIVVVLLLATCQMSKAWAYEELPFRFHVSVPDSMMFVFRGNEYRDLDIRYLPEQKTLFFNGVPMLVHSIGTEDDECLEFFSRVETAKEYFQSGLNCDDTYRRYQDDKNILMWEIGEWLDGAGQVGKSDMYLTRKLLRRCGQHHVAPDVLGALVIGGNAYVKFEGHRYSGNNLRWAPRAAARVPYGYPFPPLREEMFRYAKGIVGRVTRNQYGASSIVAISWNGGLHQSSRAGVIELGRKQLEAIRVSGEYVKGPVLESFLR